MKLKKLTRILCMLLAMLMLVCVVSCDKRDDSDKDDDTPKKTVTVNAPDGYVAYKNDDIGFAYPAGWEKTDASMVMLIDNATGNNITVAYESKSDEYENMTQAEAEEGIEMVAAAMSATASNVVLSKQTNQNGLSLVIITYDLNMISYNVTMKQTLIATNYGGRTYLITVTEVAKDLDLLPTVLSTLATAA